MWQNVIEKSSAQMMYALKVGRLGCTHELYMDPVDLCPVTFCHSHAEELD